MKKHFALIMACLMLTPAFAACTYDDNVDPVVTTITFVQDNKPVMAVCDPACAPNQVCDDGVCRDVVPCPSDSNKKCFNALDLTPNEDWATGNLTATENDYDGSSYIFSLPDKGVVTCSYPTNFYKDYCNDPNNSDECVARRENGCYMLNAYELHPFTLIKKDNSYWTDHNFDTVFTISTPNFESASKFGIYAGSDYELASRGTVSNGGTLSFENKKNYQLITNYIVNQCANQADKSFQVDKVPLFSSSDPKDVACNKAYQIMVQIRPSGNTMVCDNILTSCYDKNKSLTDCNAAVPFCLPTDCECSDAECKDGNFTSDEKTLKDTAFSAAVVKDSDKGKYYGYADSMYGWHDCRAGNVLLNNFAVYVEVSDDEITK